MKTIPQTAKKARITQIFDCPGEQQIATIEWQEKDDSTYHDFRLASLGSVRGAWMIEKGVAVVKIKGKCALTKGKTIPATA